MLPGGDGATMHGGRLCCSLGHTVVRTDSGMAVVRLSYGVCIHIVMDGLEFIFLHMSLIDFLSNCFCLAPLIRFGDDFQFVISKYDNHL